MNYIEALHHFSASDSNRGFSIKRIESKTIFGKHNEEKFTDFITLLNEVKNIREASELAGISHNTGHRYTKIFLAECERKGFPPIFTYRRNGGLEWHKFHKERWAAYMREYRKKNPPKEKVNEKLFTIEQLMQIHSTSLSDRREFSRLIKIQKEREARPYQFAK